MGFKVSEEFVEVIIDRENGCKLSVQDVGLFGWSGLDRPIISS